MKKILLSLALLTATSSIMAQSAEDKARAKAEAAALKALQKEAKAKMNEAKNIMDALMLQMQDKEKPMGEAEILEQSQKGLDLITAALDTKQVDAKKLGEAYKISETFAVNLHNLAIAHASAKEPFDTVAFLPNLITMCDGISNELKYTKVVQGEAGNEKYLKQKKEALAKSKVYFIYAAQFESECKHYENAIKAYELALDFTKNYPVVANETTCPIEDNQIAYYAYYTAHDAKKFELMDKFYPQAVTFEQGAEGVKQLVAFRYLEAGDTVQWAKALKTQCLEDLDNHADDVQRLLAYYQSLGNDKMVAFADEVLAVNPNLKIANYGKGYALFYENKYEEALKYFVHCTEVDPTYIDAWIQAGLCKYRQAVVLNATTDKMKTQKEVNVVVAKVKQISAEAIPFFEKVRELAPDEPSKWAYELKTCYKAVGNTAKAEEMDKLL